jgi:hypothetical protein
MDPEAVGVRTGRCPTCSAPIEPDWLTCRSCGAILAAVRRQAATTTPPAAPAPAVTEPTPAAVAAPATLGPTPPTGSSEGVPAWPAPPQPPAEPSPPSTPPVHTAAIAVAPLPPASQELGPNEWYSSRAAAAAGQADPQPAAAGPAREASAGVFSDLPLAIPASAGGRIAVIGLTAIVVAFFLPWSPLLPGISFFDAWGFSRSSRILVFLADVVLLALAVLPVGLSARLRTGWLPTFFGIFVVGVFWERVDSISVVGPGAWLFVIGGLLSFGGGLLTLLGHGPSSPASASV